MILRLTFLFLVCVLALLPTQSLADYRVPLQPPAGAASKAVRVEVGQQVEIILEARGNGGREVSFIMRDAPKRGKLSQIQKIQAGKAKVIYTHNSRKGVGVDYFRYAVQLSGGPVSAAGTITITAVDSGPRLEFPLLVDFGQVTLGEQPEQVIELANTGGGMISGGLAADGPFQIVSASIFQVGARGKAQMRLKFSPSSVGEFTGHAIVSAVGGGHIELIGSCIVPFSLTPEDAQLACDTEGIRAGRFSIRSSTEDELVCSLTYEGAIKGPSEVRLSPLDFGSFDVWANESEPAGGKGKVTVRAGSFEKVVEVDIAPLGPRLKVGPLAKIDLGEIKAGNSASAEIWVENTGGQPGVARVSASGLLDPPPAAITVEPGSRQTLRFQWQENAEGPSTRRIEIHPEGAGVPQVVELQAKFNVLKQAVAVPVAMDSQSTSAPKVAEAVPVEEPSDIARIERVEVTKRTATSLELKWKVPQGASEYVTELFVFERVDGRMKPVWKQVQPDGLKVKEGYAYMQLEDLDRGSSYTFRIRVKDRLDGLSAPSPEIRVATLVPKAWQIPWTGLVLGTLLVAAGWMLYLRFVRG